MSNPWTLTFLGEEEDNWIKTWTTDADLPWPTSIRLLGNFPTDPLYPSWVSITINSYNPSSPFSNYSALSYWLNLSGWVDKDNTTIFTGDVRDGERYPADNAQRFNGTDVVVYEDWYVFFQVLGGDNTIYSGGQIRVEISPEPFGSKWVGQIVMTFAGEHSDVWLTIDS